ncbi:hypothetical protein [Antrihabitans cavernicola]|uniref:hypothetical protein n=1 Tax=Antrihabitans cavernicola TaxID=2495913 RepID=UPI001659E461|nr:hypothetical protein [Spelaeibacter cavernicola]
MVGRRDRVRVEFRLPRDTATAVYRCVDMWDVTLSQAGTRLIELGLAQLDRDAEA